MLHDLLYALRRLRARPWHTLIVIAIFAVGSGAALTVLRIADAVLLHALPYKGADRLVRVSMRVPILPTQELPFSDVGYRALEQRTRSFEAIASYRVTGVNLSSQRAPERVLSARVTGTFFDVLGLPVKLGRAFVPGEEATKGPKIIILSDALWRQSFAASPAVIGTTVRIDGAPNTIVGVADARVAFPTANAGFFTLMDLDAVGTAPYELGIEVVARTKPGVAISAVIGDASRVIQDVARANPGPHSTPGGDVSGYRAIVKPLRDDMAGGIKPTIALLTAAVLFVLCLTCVNVATLELVRSSGRRPEFAIRSALGADRSRLIFGAVVEGGVQATVGVVLGLALSALSVRVLLALVPESFGSAAANAVSVGILAGAAVMVVLCTAASGAFPIAATLSSDVQSALRDRGASATRRMPS